MNLFKREELKFSLWERKEFDLWEKKELVDLLLDIQEERLSNWENQNNFDNSLVMDSTDSLREIAEKVTEESRNDHKFKMKELKLGKENHKIHMELGTEHSNLLTRAHVEKTRINANNDEAWYGYKMETTKTKHCRDRWIMLYATRTVQTGFRWILSAVTLISGAYIYFYH